MSEYGDSDSPKPKALLVEATYKERGNSVQGHIALTADTVQSFMNIDFIFFMIILSFVEGAQSKTIINQLCLH